jgi:hypothetical protein
MNAENADAPVTDPGVVPNHPPTRADYRRSSAAKNYSACGAASVGASGHSAVDISGFMESLYWGVIRAGASNVLAG